MEYTVQKLGRMAGVSARTLRYYDGIGDRSFEAGHRGLFEGRNPHLYRDERGSVGPGYPLNRSSAHRNTHPAFRNDKIIWNRNPQPKITYDLPVES